MLAVWVKEQTLGGILNESDTLVQRYNFLFRGFAFLSHLNSGAEYLHSSIITFYETVIYDWSQPSKQPFCDYAYDILSKFQICQLYPSKTIYLLSSSKAVQFCQRVFDKKDKYMPYFSKIIPAYFQCNKLHISHGIYLRVFF